jgi:hypothetical protein
MITNQTLYLTKKREETLKKLIKICEISVDDKWDVFLPMFIRMINNSGLKTSDRIVMGFIINSINSDTTSIQLLNFRINNFLLKGYDGIMFKCDKKLMEKIIIKTK